MATKAIEDKKHEMEATMVNLGDKVGSNIQQVAGDMMGAASVRRLDGEDGDQESPLPSSSFQVRSQEQEVTTLHTGVQATPPVEEKSSWYTLQSVKMIDNYSRRIFPTAYILFVLYFFIRS